MSHSNSTNGEHMSLEEVIVEFHRLGIPEVKERELKLPTELDKATVVYGLRRSGKNSPAVSNYTLSKIKNPYS